VPTLTKDCKCSPFCFAQIQKLPESEKVVKKF